MIIKYIILSACILTISQAQAQESRVEVGSLTCRVEGSSGFVFGSTKNLKCTYRPLNAKPIEKYTGTISKYGIDFGITGKTIFIWAVLAKSRDLPKGAFSGKYKGISAKASIGAGLGLKLLVGGSDNTIALQPLSVQAQTGLNIALAVETLKLKTIETKTTFQENSENNIKYRLCGTTITYAPGDTLYNIASRCGTTLDALLENNKKITNVINIPIGTKIIVPNYPLPSPNQNCGLYEIAKKNETLTNIAHKCKISLGALINENPQLPYRKPLKEGDKISIPSYPTPLVRRSCDKEITLGVNGSPFQTLNSIAEICGTTIAALLQANPKIKNVRNIKKNTKINIPQIPLPIAQTKCGSNTIALKGETIYAIALRCQTTPGAIIDLNEELGKYDIIPEGQTIRIASQTLPMPNQ